MRAQSIGTRSRAGAALITALLFVAIFSVVIAGIAILAVGHNTLATRESDYASSIQVADAAINYELRYVSQNQYAPGFVIHDSGNPDIGTIAGVPNSSFQAWITAYDGSTAWSSTQLATDNGNFIIFATGTVNGVTRKVRAHATAGTNFSFPGFAAYGVVSLNFSGSNSGAFGNAGTNGTFNTSPIGTACVQPTGASPPDGFVMLNGPNATLIGANTGNNLLTTSDPLFFPTVNQVVAASFSSGWSALNGLTNTGNMRQFTSAAAYTAWSVAHDPNLISAALTTPVTSWTKNQQLSHNDINKQQSNTVILTVDPVKAAAGQATDFYFTDIGSQPGDTIIVDNAGRCSAVPKAGLIRIWMNGSVGNDTISNSVDYTAIDKGLTAPQQYFALYDNKTTTTFNIGGATTIQGGLFYGVTAIYPPTAGTLVFKISGNSSVAGSLIADNINFTGNSIVTFNGTAPNPPNPLWLWFGIKDGWQELPINTGVTFPDGTSN